MPTSRQASSPAWRTSPSTSCLARSYISSIRAGWMRPSETSFSRVRRPISRRTGSKQDSRTASGVSSMIRSTPVTASKARMLRPSRPMMRPFMSSRRQREDGDGRLRGLLGGDPLDGQGDDLARAAVGLLPRLLLEVADQAHGVALGLLLDLLDEHGLGLGGGHGRDLLEAAAVLLGGGLELGPGRLEGLLAVVEGDLAAVEQGRLGVEALLPAGQAVLALLGLGAAGPGLDLDFSSKLCCFGLGTLAQARGLVAGLDGGLAAGGLGLAAAVLKQGPGLLLGRPEHGCRLFALVLRSDEEPDNDPSKRSNDENDGLHGGLLCNPHPAGGTRPAKATRRRCRDRPTLRRQQRRAAPGAAEALRLRSEGRVRRNVRVGRPRRRSAPQAGRSGEQSVYQGYVIMG